MKLCFDINKSKFIEKSDSHHFFSKNNKENERNQEFLNNQNIEFNISEKERNFDANLMNMPIFSFNDVEHINSLLEESKFDEIHNIFRSDVYLDRFLDYFSGFLGVTTVDNMHQQMKLSNVLAFLVFYYFEKIPNFAHLGTYLLFGWKRRMEDGNVIYFIKPTLEQQFVVLRWFFMFFNQKWFSIKYNEYESIVLHLFKHVSPKDDVFYMCFVKFILNKIPANSNCVHDFSEGLCSHDIYFPEQVSFHFDLINMCPSSPPFYSFFALIQYSIKSPFSKLAMFFLRPSLAIYYENSDVIRRAFHNYLRRIIQYCIVSQKKSLHKEQVSDIVSFLYQIYQLPIKSLSDKIQWGIGAAQFYNCLEDITFCWNNKNSRTKVYDKEIIDEISYYSPYQILESKLLDLPKKTIPLIIPETKGKPFTVMSTKTKQRMFLAEMEE